VDDFAGEGASPREVGITQGVAGTGEAFAADDG
jgi:hypothetical protein